MNSRHAKNKVSKKGHFHIHVKWTCPNWKFPSVHSVTRRKPSTSPRGRGQELSATTHRHTQFEFQLASPEERPARPLALSSIRRYNEEKSTYDRLKKIVHKPSKIRRYYYHPLETLRFDYQALVPQTNDFTPIIYNPGLWRANHGYGFNEWGSQGVA